jgi:hypothetical protein
VAAAGFETLETRDIGLDESGEAGSNRGENRSGSVSFSFTFPPSAAAGDDEAISCRLAGRGNWANLTERSYWTPCAAHGAPGGKTYA